MKNQTLIIIDGLNGAGKTTVSHLLHSKLKHSALLSFDKTKRLISNFEPTEEYLSLTNRILRAMVKEYLGSGLNVIIESIFPKEEFILPYLKIAKQQKARSFVYQIEAPFDVRFKRISQRPLAEGAKKKMTKNWVKRNDAAYLTGKYTKAAIVHSHNQTPQQIVNTIMKDLNA